MPKLGVGVAEVPRVLFGLLGWKLVRGYSSDAIGIVYALLLRRVPLTIVQSSAAAQFVGVIIAASLMLGEPISPAGWPGSACICSGSSWSVSMHV
jgi:drug/metabolite transporter (DMT)-like permease